MRRNATASFVGSAASCCSCCFTWQDGCTAPLLPCAHSTFWQILTSFYCMSFPDFGDILSGCGRGWWLSELFANFEVLDLDILCPHQQHGVRSFWWNRLGFWPMIGSTKLKRHGNATADVIKLSAVNFDKLYICQQISLVFEIGSQPYRLLGYYRWFVFQRV